jgi:hypothetical protein
MSIIFTFYTFYVFAQICMCECVVKIRAKKIMSKKKVT